MPDWLLRRKGKSAPHTNCDHYNVHNVQISIYGTRCAKQGGWWGSQPPPPEFWKGGLNTCQPSLILRGFFLIAHIN